jgi:hypothetical protein
MRSENNNLPARLLSRSQVVPGLVSAVSTSPGRNGRKYSKCCSAFSPPADGALPSMPVGPFPEPNHFSPGLGREPSGLNYATAAVNVGGAMMPPTSVSFARSAS